MFFSSVTAKDLSLSTFEDQTQSVLNLDLYH